VVGGKIFIRRPRKLLKLTTVHDITKLNAELKSDDVKSRNKIIYITVVVLSYRRRSIATGSTALTPYLDLLGVGKNCSLMK